MADKSGSEFVEDATETVHDSNVVAKPTYKVGADVDDALQLALTDTEVSWSEEEERKVVRKIDWVLLPVLFLGTLIGYADGQAFGFSALFGLVQDLKLFTVSLVNGQPVVDESKYQLAAGIVSLGGAAGQYPLLYLAQHLPSGIVYGASIVYVGTLAILTIACTNFKQIMALRFFYGFSQVLQPMAIIIVAMWWKTSEQPLRLGLIIAGNALGSLAGNGVDFGAIKIKGPYAASPWKWIYVILGPCAMAVGIATLLMLPSTPVKAWFLTPRERKIAILRLRSNNTGVHTRKFKWKQALSTFLDPQLWALLVFSFTFSFSNVAISSFGGFLVSSFGYSAERSLLLFMPASAMALVCILAAGVIGNRFPQHRLIVAVCFIIPSLVGSLMIWKLDRHSKSALLAGLYISTMFYGALVQHYSLLAANIAGHSKKTVTNATITIMAALGGFCGPWAYRSDQAAENYRDGQIANLSLMAASIFAYIFLWFYYTYQNKKRAASLADNQHTIDPNVAFMDLTDRENPTFVYTR